MFLTITLNKLQMKFTYLMIFLCVSVYSQKSIKITYEQLTSFRDGFFEGLPDSSREQTKKAMTSPMTFELFNNDKISLFKSAEVKDILIPSTEPSQAGVIDRGTVLKLPEVWIMKDFKTEKTFAKRNIEEKNYYIQESFRKEEFIFTNEQKIIESFKCKRAYSLPKNKPNDTIKYWYTDEIPIFDGPYYTVGIPGLILKYERKNRVVYATKIEFFDKIITIDGLTKNIPIVTQKEFEIIKEKNTEPKSYTDENGRKIKTSTQVIKP